MSNFTKSLCVFLLTGFIFLSCKKEEDVGPKNTISVEGTEYELAQGLLIDYGPYGLNQPNAQVLFLYSSGVKIHEVGGKLDSTSGNGHAIYFELSSSVSKALTEGEYLFNPYPPFKAETFLYSYAVFKANFVTFDGEFYEMAEGKITVKKEGINYVISFDCTETDGKHITGFYKGPLTVYDEG